MRAVRFHLGLHRWAQVWYALWPGKPTVPTARFVCVRGCGAERLETTEEAGANG